MQNGKSIFTKSNEGKYQLRDVCLKVEVYGGPEYTTIKYNLLLHWKQETDAGDLSALPLFA
jgi:hypothetical protein